MFRHMRISTSIIMVLVIFTLLQVGSNITAFSFIKHDRENVNFLGFAAKEEGQAYNSWVSMLQAQTMLDTIVMDLAAEPDSVNNVAASVAAVREKLALSDKQIKLFIDIPGLTVKKPEIGDAMIVVHEARMKTLREQLDLIEKSPNVPALLQAMKKQQSTNAKARNDYIARFEGYVKEVEKALAEAGDDSQTAFQTFTILFIGALIVAIILFIVVHLWLKRLLIQPLQQISEHFSFMARGDLSRDVTSGSNNEIGKLFNELKEMQAGLVETVSSIRDGVDSISVGTREIAAGNQDLSSRTEQQAAALAETAAAMEQLTSTVKQNADNSSEASRMILATTDIARSGGNVMGSVVSKMHVINGSSRKVSDIISVIDSIAFQTNILALNAAVEAARAGEQGRGFAVVAGEVRSLAQRCAQAAKEINGLIQESTNGIKEGVTLVENAGQTMAEIVKSVEHVTQLMESISYASNEQSQGIEQVRIAINEMDKVTQQNAALVEEVAATAAGVETQSSSLAHSVATFQL